MGQEKKGLTVALEMLSRRDRSEAELRRRLRDKGICDEEIDAVTVRLKELNYLDDRRLAERLAAAAVSGGKGFGIRLSRDLVRRGIPRGVVDEVIADIASAYDERELVRELVLRKFPAFQSSTLDNREKIRMLNYLLRKGFSRSAVFDVMRHPTADFTD